MNYDRPLTSSEISDFKTLLLRRNEHEPLQYITGSTEFMGLPFLVQPGVLIPRPDTEILVETIFEYYRSNPAQKPLKLLDIGTGSGAIIIALASMFEKHSIQCDLWAMDINPQATELAVRNAELKGFTGIHFFPADVFDDAWMEPHKTSFHGIVSNPPYISDREYELLPDEVRLFEPKDALNAEHGGLVFYERISEIAVNLLNRSDSGPALFYEIGYKQAKSIMDILLKSGFKNIEFVKDYQHIQRVVRANL
jgi:release factor glutamine methyltransferase